jgi:hypothetical protein
MLTDLGQAFDAAGLSWVGVGASPYDPTGAADWTTRGRPASTGDFRPAGVLCHHTASPAGTSAQTDLNVILAGNAEAPGPIGQCYVGRDAVLYVVAAGRGNHGGRGIRPGVDSTCSDMNLHLLGIEVGNDGMGEPWPDPVISTYARTVAALIDWYGWPLEAVYLHATTGPPSGGCNSKIDPAGPWHRQPNLPGGGAGTWDLDVWRAFVAEQLPGPGPTPRPPQGDLMLTLFQCTDAWGCFLGFSVGGVGQLVEWTDGAAKAYYEQLGAVVQAITVDQCSGFTLMGPLPQGDQLHTWTGAEFRRIIT